MRRIIFGALIVLALIYFVYAVTLPSHLHADHEMKYCGGCHEEGSVVCPGGFNLLEADYLEVCPQVMGSVKLHAEMVSSECDRCHQYGYEPMYSNCNLCHVSHHELVPGIETEGIDCISCHSSHTLVTDYACERCHNDEYIMIKTMGGKHALLDDSCYSCHTEHASSKNCLECHEVIHGSSISLDCTECHQPHSPAEFDFSTVTAEQCNQCHDTVVQQFIDHPSKHSNVTCVECHTDHKNKAQCSDCHANVHSQLSESDIDKCSGCHGKAHSPSRYG
jgi:hypothetical protein